MALARADDGAKAHQPPNSSKLPELIALVMTRPLVSAGMVVKTLDITPQAARPIVGELGLGKMTGRGGFGRGGGLARTGRDGLYLHSVQSERRVAYARARTLGNDHNDQNHSLFWDLIGVQQTRFDLR